MNKFVLAALGLLAVGTIANAESFPPQVVPAPGTVVEVDGQHCLLMSAGDRTAWCVGVGKIAMPECTRPAIVWIPGTTRKNLVCADGIALK